MKRALFVCLALLMAVSVVLAQDEEDNERQTEEKNAVRMLRLLNNAELSYAMTYKEEGFACTLKQLGPAGTESPSARAAGFIAPELASGKSEKYSFHLHCAEGEKPYIRVTITAVPDDVKAGERAFCSDMYVSMGKVTGGIINASKDGKASTCLIQGAPLR